MFEKILNFFGFIIITKKAYEERIENIKIKFDEMNAYTVWSKLDPVFNDLEDLKGHTWDQDKITEIEEYLVDNFFTNR